MSANFCLTFISVGIKLYFSRQNAEKEKIFLTEFEIITAMMFLYFKRNGVEIVILETGMGGRFDATNVIKENGISRIVFNFTYSCHKSS